VVVKSVKNKILFDNRKMHKRIDDKLKEFKLKEEKLPELQEKLECYRRKYCKLKKKLENSEASTIAHLPPAEGSSGPPLKGAVRPPGVPKGRKRPFSEDERRELRQKICKISKAIHDMEAEIAIMKDDRGLQDYWLNAGKYLYEIEEAQRVEASAMAEMEFLQPRNATSQSSSLLDYLSVLPATTPTTPSGATTIDDLLLGSPSSTTTNTLESPIIDTTTSQQSTTTSAKKKSTSKKRKVDDSAPKAPSAGGFKGDGTSPFSILEVLRPSANHTQIIVKPQTREKEIYAEYLSRVEGDDSKIKESIAQQVIREHGVCSRPECRGELQFDFRHENIMYCETCGSSEFMLAEEDVGTFNEPVVKPQAAFTYKKKNHFRDWLARSQGKEGTNIPDVVYDALLNELRKLRVKNSKEVTRELLIDLLRKLKMPKYYKNIAQIHYHITGKRPPQFSQLQESTLMQMFLELEPVYEQVKRPGRGNFFSYSYCIHKFCEIQYELTADESWQEKKKHFSLLRGNSKLYETDQMWKDCCKIIKWPFSKSF
jgi:hypothetical protein